MDTLNNIPGLAEDKLAQAYVRLEWARRGRIAIEAQIKAFRRKWRERLGVLKPLTAPQHRCWWCGRQLRFIPLGGRCPGCGWQWKEPDDGKSPRS